MWIRRGAVECRRGEAQGGRHPCRPLVGGFTLDRYGHLLLGPEQQLNDALDDLAKEVRTADGLPGNGPNDTELPGSIAHVARTPTGLRSDAADTQPSDQGLLGGR
jgi:hypothetical protein